MSRKTCDEFVTRDADLVRMCDPDEEKFGINFYGELRKRVMTEYVINHINSNALIKGLSDVYVLAANLNSDRLVEPGEKTWKEVLPNHIDKFADNRLPLAIVMITEHPKYVEIEWIASNVRGCGFAQILLDRIVRKFDKPYIPTDVRPAPHYWRRYLENIELNCEIAGFKIQDIIGYDMMVNWERY